MLYNKVQSVPCAFGCCNFFWIFSPHSVYLPTSPITAPTDILQYRLCHLSVFATLFGQLVSSTLLWIIEVNNSLSYVGLITGLGAGIGIVHHVYHWRDQDLPPHSYANDSQVYGSWSCWPTAVEVFSYRVSECIDAIISWVKWNTRLLSFS